jgi:hypothetical protein
MLAHMRMILKTKAQEDMSTSKRTYNNLISHLTDKRLLQLDIKCTVQQKY